MAHISNRNLLLILATAAGVTLGVILLSYAAAIFASFIILFAALLAVGILRRERTTRKCIIEDVAIAAVVSIPLYYFNITFSTINVWSTLIFAGILIGVLFIYEIIKAVAK